jgi:hypothetical protein
MTLEGSKEVSTVRRCSRLSSVKDDLATQYELKAVEILKTEGFSRLILFFLINKKILIANARIFTLKLAAKKKTMKNLIYNGFCSENYYILF